MNAPQRAKRGDPVAVGEPRDYEPLPIKITQKGGHDYREVWRDDYAAVLSSETVSEPFSDTRPSRLSEQTHATSSAKTIRRGSCAPAVRLGQTRHLDLRFESGNGRR